MATKKTKSSIRPLRPGSGWTYAPAPESAAIARIDEQYELFIDGKWQKPSGGSYFDSINPANEKKLYRAALANEKDVEKAVTAARKAFDKYWKKMPPAERGKYIFRVARLMQEQARELSIMETLDGGKPIRESRDFDVPMACNHFFYYAGWADKLEYAFPNRTPKPIGVAAQITPWNFPLLMAAWKIAPALATGNTIVLKPAETTSLTTLKLASIIQEADLPPGVVNIITGAGNTGAALVRHPGINKIAFTGSTAVGKLIQQETASSNKKLTLELGGKAANIIFSDAPIDQAVEGVVNGIFFNQGHVCCAGSRVYVQESIVPIFLQKLKDRMATLLVGDPMDKNTDIGAINSAEQLEKINYYIRLGKKEGSLHYENTATLPKKGFYCRPTLFTKVAQSSRLAQEEIFGPVLAILTFRTEDEVIEKANNTPYGLSAGVWTDKGSRIFNMSKRLKAGVVWANSYNLFDPTSPFGGYKESGYGREGGLHGLSPYVTF
jgi:aldehyde dehydrogenase (NAD+)